MSERGGEQVAAEPCVELGATPGWERYPARAASLGALAIVRALPIRERRLVGPWCFLDRFGPLTFTEGRPMDVPPHPHIGLQTVTWLLDGEIRHDDSLGCEAIARPGAVNVMTAGSGISHSERTPDAHSGRLDGVQLWVALPEAHRQDAPSFQKVAEVPVVEAAGGRVQVFAGSLAGVTSSARHHTPLVGADVALHRAGRVEVDVDPTFEHALLLLEGACAVDGERLEERVLYALGPGRSAVDLASDGGGRVLLVGGAPFTDPMLMWWNFVAGTPEAIAEARADWEAHRRFGEVRGYPGGARLAAPPLHRLARPNPAS